jgi:hypothetical protein
VSAVEAKGLGRRVPSDWNHVEKFPLSALPESAQPVGPVVLGINWYGDFDTPVKKGADWFIGLNAQSLGSVRGGHCVCLEPGRNGMKDTVANYRFYNQGHEGACVGFGSSRAMSLLNRQKYYARWLWDHAKMTDEWPDTNPGDDNGTSVRAAMDILRLQGHVLWKAKYASEDVPTRDAHPASLQEGIFAFRWATSTDDVLKTLENAKATRLGAVPILNSWGSSYPQRVWMPVETLDRLRREEGEIAVITDR